MSFAGYEVAFYVEDKMLYVDQIQKEKVQPI